MKFKPLPDEVCREPLTYEERSRALGLLRNLVGEGKLSGRFSELSSLVQRACRIPPGPDGADVEATCRHMVGDEWMSRDGTRVITGVVKKLRLCGPGMDEVFGLIQINGANWPLFWSKMP